MCRWCVIGRLEQVRVFRRDLRHFNLLNQVSVGILTPIRNIQYNPQQGVRFEPRFCSDGPTFTPVSTWNSTHP
jgi:hypothetical protein